MLKDLPQNKTLRKYNNYFQFILIQINQRHLGDSRTASHLFLFLIIYYALFFPRELYLGLYSLKVKFCKQTVYLKAISLEACLKSDYENEIFYAKCKNILIDRRNNFNHNKKKCYRDFEFSDRILLVDNVRIHVIFKILTNFLLSVILLLFLIIPAFIYILFFL